MQHHTLAVSRTAHYYTLGTPGAHIRHYWLVCHGYAQLADELLAAFTPIAEADTLIVAPEGLNYFYKKGFGGAPGATWMTRQHRLDEIHDYVAYLQQLHVTILAQLPEKVQVTLFGFSQGVATVTRWAIQQNPHCHNVVWWAGLPPDDEQAATAALFLKDKRRFFCYGTQDPFLTPDRMGLFAEYRAHLGLDLEWLEFEGEHTVEAAALRQLRERLLSVAG